MQESPVFVKMFEFVAWLIPLSVKFPRQQRFVVAAAVQRATFAAHEALIRAGQSAEPATALAHLNEVAAQLALVRFHLRLSERLLLISVNQYEYASECLAELGRLVQAWRRSCRTKTTIIATPTTAVPGAASS
ncbi:MAG: hypothetical protein OJF49_000908 [Ktedonobacterales bacterium]|jgi:uncharacterized protein YecE (DUF72 family)|nr:MAG: hypothetical protein OJF49_000908 [Ktedonobacterales bacterium]